MSEQGNFHPLSVEIPGPVWHGGLSHGVHYDNVNRCVKMYAIIHGHRIFCTSRPMVGSEIIYAKLEGHSREEVLRAYGVDEEENRRLLAEARQRKPWWKFW